MTDIHQVISGGNSLSGSNLLSAYRIAGLGTLFVAAKEGTRQTALAGKDPGYIQNVAQSEDTPSLLDAIIDHGLERSCAIQRAYPNRRFYLLAGAKPLGRKARLSTGMPQFAIPQTAN